MTKIRFVVDPPNDRVHIVPVDEDDPTIDVTVCGESPGGMQDLRGKGFPLFSLVEGETYVDYDLIYIYNDMLFNGSKNVDGRAFDRPENRPTNFQIPLARQR